MAISAAASSARFTLPCGSALTNVAGDLMSSSDSLAHCVSACLGMGKGIAVLFKSTFNSVDALKAQNVGVGGTAILRLPAQRRNIYYLITKPKYSDKPTYDTLRASVKAMFRDMAASELRTVSAPVLGCGLDLLEWPKVQQLLLEELAGTGIAMTIYHFVPPPGSPASVMGRGGRGGRGAGGRGAGGRGAGGRGGAGADAFMSAGSARGGAAASAGSARVGSATRADSARAGAATATVAAGAHAAGAASAGTAGARPARAGGAATGADSARAGPASAVAATSAGAATGAGAATSSGSAGAGTTGTRPAWGPANAGAVTSPGAFPSLSDVTGPGAGTTAGAGTSASTRMSWAAALAAGPARPNAAPNADAVSAASRSRY